MVKYLRINISLGFDQIQYHFPTHLLLSQELSLSLDALNAGNIKKCQV